MFAVLYACPFYSQRSDAVQRIKVKKASSDSFGLCFLSCLVGGLQCTDDAMKRKTLCGKSQVLV